MGEKAVRLRRATLEDFSFCKEMHDDIINEVLYGNFQAFLELPEIPELIKAEKKKEDVIIEFDEPDFTFELFEKQITKFHDKYYIIELVNFDKDKVKQIGSFRVEYMDRKEPNRINSWGMIPKFFTLKGVALKELLNQKELINKKITIISTENWLDNWLAQFGFEKKDSIRLERKSD